MADLRQVVNSGPDDDSLLYLQSRHISQDIWINKRDRILRIRRCILVDNPPLAIVPHLRAAGFYGVSRLGTFEHNPALVSALVERWRPETHTFHTTKGECTITLQDVAVQFGLPCGGKPVTGGASMDWQTLCERLLGVAPPSSKLDGQRLSMNWLTDTFSHLPEDATDEQVACFSRAYILRLIGGYLMPDKSGNKVYLMYLPFLEDFTECGGFSWGSAVLAHLYRELCMATDPKQKEIGGCLTLLHIWAWDRFPRVAPFTRPISNLDLEHYPLLPPLGHRWRGAKDSVGPAKEALKHYRLLLDRMTDLEIIWCPYEGEVFQMIPEYCLVDQNVWRAYVPLICFHIVEWHHPDRVLRQFGGDQSIPQPPINLGRHHTLQLTGKYDKNWTVEHQEFIKQWDAWQERVIQLQYPSLPLQQNSEYMRWYWKHTRRWIDLMSGAEGYAVDMAWSLYRLTLEDPRPKDLIEKFQQGAMNIITAMGEQKELRLSHPAPPAQHLPAAIIPEVVPGKRSRGLVAAREPIPYDACDAPGASMP